MYVSFYWEIVFNHQVMARKQKKACLHIYSHNSETVTALFTFPPATKWALQIWPTCMWSGMSWRGTWCPWFCPTPSTASREARRPFTSTTCPRSSSRSSPASYSANLSSLSMWANEKHRNYSYFLLKNGLNIISYSSCLCPFPTGNPNTGEQTWPQLWDYPEGCKS